MTDIYGRTWTGEEFTPDNCELTQMQIEQINCMIAEKVMQYKENDDITLDSNSVVFRIFYKNEDFVSIEIRSDRGNKTAYFCFKIPSAEECQKKNASDKLTKEEQIFAEKHHDEVYKFLNSKKLSIEEYYDVVIIGYLKGIKDYCRKESARKYSLSTVVTRSMLDCVYKEWRAESTNKRKINHIAYSLDANVMEEGKEKNLYEVVADTRNVFEDFEMKELIQKIFSTLSQKGTEILQLLICGYNQTEIQKICNIKRKAFNSEMEIIRNNYMELCKG